MKLARTTRGFHTRGQWVSHQVSPQAPSKERNFPQHCYQNATVCDAEQPLGNILMYTDFLVVLNIVVSPPPHPLSARYGTVRNWRPAEYSTCRSDVGAVWLCVAGDKLHVHGRTAPRWQLLIDDLGVCDAYAVRAFRKQKWQLQPSGG